MKIIILLFILPLFSDYLGREWTTALEKISTFKIVIDLSPDLKPSRFLVDNW